jgi:hypothetical protein
LTRICHLPPAFAAIAIAGTGHPALAPADDGAFGFIDASPPSVVDRVRCRAKIDERFGALCGPGADTVGILALKNSGCNL